MHFIMTKTEAQGSYGALPGSCKLPKWHLQRGDSGHREESRAGWDRAGRYETSASPLTQHATEKRINCLLLESSTQSSWTTMDQRNRRTQNHSWRGREAAVHAPDISGRQVGDFSHVGRTKAAACASGYVDGAGAISHQRFQGIPAMLLPYSHSARRRP